MFPDFRYEIRHLHLGQADILPVFWEYCLNGLYSVIGMHICAHSCPQRKCDLGVMNEEEPVVNKNCIFLQIQNHDSG